MSLHVPLRPFYSDARGNRLAEWAVVDHSSGHHLWLRGSGEIVTQVLAAFPAYKVLPLPVSASIAWTHVLTGSDRLLEMTRDFLNLLKSIISLPNPTGIKTALALDWYKQPVDGLDAHSWLNTEIGELVSKGKYLYPNNNERQSEVGRDVVARVCDVVIRHTLLNQAELVLNVPGHDSTKVSFGSRMAATVASDLKLEQVPVKSHDKFRPASKNMTAAQQAEIIPGRFYIERSIRGRTALIVDDIFHTGTSMGETARAAISAGASVVYGVCAVRTMKK
jgi:Phosphoribosyl transferase domain